MNTITYHVGDVRDVMAQMSDNTVDLLVTSPPFLALRSYLPADHPDKHREIGSEPTPATFLDTMLGLTAEWRRLVTPTGSIAVEIGDTYSGSGGGGGDYLPGGWREGQQQFAGSAASMRESNAAHWRQKNAEKDGWPLAKSLCLIPELYAVALAYGHNPLTGQPSPAGRMRVRNWLTWTRPNPPVGALGDKFRPATSFVTVACTSAQRWFDLDAVRTPHRDPDDANRSRIGLRNEVRAAVGLSSLSLGGVSNPAGAPPLDWWEEDWQPLHRLPTSPYAGAHYAAYPIALPRRLIQAMCPRQVCVVCGEPRRRIVENTYTPRSDAVLNGHRQPRVLLAGSDVNPSGQGMRHGEADKHVTTIGWTDCDCFNQRTVYEQTTRRPGVVLDPFGGSGTTAVAAAQAGRDAVLIDLDRRNVDLCRQRIQENLHVVSEVQVNGTFTWTVRCDLPGLKGEHPDQQSLFNEATA